MKTKENKTTPRMTLGKKGEDEACSFLMEMGHSILERNRREGHLEIDIISLDKNGVHFVEVKSRVAPVAAAPQENVTPAKQRKVADAALRYLNGSKDSRLSGDLEVSFDIVAVTFRGGETEVEYFPKAFIPVYV